MKIINRDILTIDKGLIVHQTNCQGVMGAGLAKKIADKWPVVKHDYLKDYALNADGGPLLGDWLRTEVANGLFVASVYGQENYGRKPGYCYTSYRALAISFSAINYANQSYEFYPSKLPVYIPYGLGCGLAGGDWHVVSALIEQELPDAVICKLP
ncbi:hypothetical protein Lepto7375DRAFT_7411 [Leptolyngbya sp. PCC 7375]|nr:hypothetical protein Lepto7375DRAFT_7411 [Leptolyngbya sp. PCC 7375]